MYMYLCALKFSGEISLCFFTDSLLCQKNNETVDCGSVGGGDDDDEDNDNDVSDSDDDDNNYVNDEGNDNGDDNHDDEKYDETIASPRFYETAGITCTSTFL